MLEVLVFSKRIMEKTKNGSTPMAAEKIKTADEYHLLPERKSRKKMPEINVSNLKNLMWDKVGIIRNKEGLTAVANIFAAWQRGLPLTERVSYELSNMILTGHLMTEAALIREESRGAQFRTDFPDTSPAWQHHIILTNK
jgi:L-aspartate oxidase